MSARMLCFFDKSIKNPADCHIIESKSPLKLLKKGDVDFAIVDADELKEKYDNNSKLYSIAALYKKMLHFVVNPNSKIASLQEIKDDKFHIGYVKRNSRYLLQVISKKFDIDSSKFIDIDANQTLQMMKSGKLDGYITVVPNPCRALQNDLNNSNYKVLQVSGKPYNQIIRSNDFLLKDKIKKESYKNQDYDIISLGIKSILVTSKLTEKRKVYDLTDAIIKNIDKFKTLDPIYHNISKKELLEEMVIPQHKSAIKAFNGAKFDSKL